MADITIKKLLEEIKRVLADPKPSETLPQNTFYLSNERVLAMPRSHGESRFPYDEDGFVVFAYQTGYISACDSTFTVFRNAHFGEEAPVAFFGGLERPDGTFFPLSVTGASRQLFEPEGTKRYVVFSLRSCRYIAECEGGVFCLRMNVTENKDIHFTLNYENLSGENKKIYLASFAEALLRFGESEGFWDKMSKFGRRLDNGSVILWSRNGREDCLTVNTAVSKGRPTMISRTVGRTDFCGGKGRTVANAESLRIGRFEKEAVFATTTELPIAADIIHFDVAPGDSVTVEYEMTVSHGMEAAEAAVGKMTDSAENERKIALSEDEDRAVFDRMRVKFSDWKGDVDAELMNRFVRSIQKQVSFCAHGKNYAGPHIGIRDVFQQLEGSLMWHPEKSREKILVAMNYIMSDGRAPRQFSIPQDPADVPDFDLRMYVDQGVWVISTIHTYIAFTGDVSILDEEAGYYDLLDEATKSLRRSDERDSVLSHLIRICDFLASKLDRGHTWCMRALYGDWNDALDGLGRTADPDRDYGDGVSVMTTLQYYQNLSEMCELLALRGGYDEKIKEYGELRSLVEKGLFEFALEDRGGDVRVIHGWGDRMSYKVGSHSDCDGIDRFSLTANAFWAISGMMAKDPSVKHSLMRCCDSVESRYGLKTFSAPFAMETRPYIGRLATITVGTAENCCAYVHASMFGIMALFIAGESERAWRELERSVVLTHDNCSMTSFVMPNSWCDNVEMGIDGDSMGDWYTGSGVMFIKELVRFGFGIMPTLGGLTVRTPRTMPCNEAAIEISLKGHPVTLRYKNEGNGTRRYFVDGKEVETTVDPLSETPQITMSADSIGDGTVITVTD